MGQVMGLIQAIVRLGMMLTLVGGLGEATLDSYHKARSARSTGLIHLGKLNRALQSGVGGR
jgi:hypothetical protein